MTATFFIAAIGMTLVALLLVVSPLLRHQFKAQRRAGALRTELQALNAANAAGTVTPAQYAACRHALGEALLDYIAIEPTHARQLLFQRLPSPCWCRWRRSAFIDGAATAALQAQH